MKVYINGSGCISAQATFDKSGESGYISHTGNRWACEEPEYSKFIDGKQIRRMSRIIRMGIVSSMLASREAGISNPDAVIVGTALGCLEDTYAFLSKMVQYREDMLSPTAFIHSTHNTIAAQIALLSGCSGYNSTYVHRALSFESALMDALMLINEHEASNVLVSGIDEITDASFTIMERMGFYKKTDTVNDGNLFGLGGKGSVAGEGAAFFSLSGTQNTTSQAELCGVELVSFASADKVASLAGELLSKNEIAQPDLFIAGHNGDRTNDEANDRMAALLNCTGNIMKYKNLCGEFATASAFATWLGARILNQNIPGWPGLPENGSRPASILIYNQQENNHHSLILLRAC